MATYAAVDFALAQQKIAAGTDLSAYPVSTLAYLGRRGLTSVSPSGFKAAKAFSYAGTSYAVDAAVSGLPSGVMQQLLRTGYVVGVSGYAAIVLADAPLGYWRLGEPSGAIMTDSSGNGRNGTYVGSPGLATAGLVPGDPDTCVDITPDQYAQVARAAWMDVTALTVEAIITPDSVSGGDKQIVCRDDLAAGPGTRCFQFGIQGSTGEIFAVLFVRGSGAAVVFTGGATPLVAGTRYHVALTSDGTTMKIYRNGVVDQSSAFAASIDTSTLEGVKIGRSGHASVFNSFDGRVDEVAYYGTALTQARISARVAAAGL